VLGIIGGTVASLIGNSLLSRLSTLNVNVIHAMPGRVRLQCNTWKNENVAAILAEFMKRHPLVKEASCSPITGSMVISFKELYLTNQQFQEVIETAVKATGKAVTAKKSETTNKMIKVMGRLNRQVKISTKGLLDIPALIILALTINGIRGFNTNRTNSVKELLWAYRMLRGEEAMHID